LTAAWIDLNCSEVAGWVEIPAERGGKGRIRWSGINESDDRHRRRLRV